MIRRKWQSFSWENERSDWQETAHRRRVKDQVMFTQVYRKIQTKHNLIFPLHHPHAMTAVAPVFGGNAQESLSIQQLITEHVYCIWKCFLLNIILSFWSVFFSLWSILSILVLQQLLEMQRCSHAFWWISLLLKDYLRWVRFFRKYEYSWTF